jgi:hypothetical protein
MALIRIRSAKQHHMAPQMAPNRKFCIRTRHRDSMPDTWARPIDLRALRPIDHTVRPDQSATLRVTARGPSPNHATE